MSASPGYATGAADRPLWSNPYLLVGGGIIVMLLGLAFGGHFAIGPSYWDMSIYLDAAQRIANGQKPNVDFLTPAGPLEYYLFYIVNRLFPDSHPLLSTHWATLAVTIPLYLLVLKSIDIKSRSVALLVTVPFLCFALLPINTVAHYPAPGFDGYGIYNRHPALLIYVLVAALLFVGNRLLLQVVIGLALLSLFFMKITGFVSGVLLVGYAFLAGRVRFTDTVLCALAVIIALGVIELSTGIVTAYLQNVIQLAGLNEGSFIRRFRPFVGSHLELFLPLSLAVLLLALIAIRENSTEGNVAARLRRLLDSDPAWLAAIVICAFIFEIQNTGSQEFIYIIPAVMLTLHRLWYSQHVWRFGIIAILAAMSLPLFTTVAYRGVQTLISQTTYQKLDQPVLGPLGRVSSRSSFFLRAAAMNRHYVEARDSYRKLANEGISHSDILTAEPDFQLAWLINTAAAVRALLAFEANSGRQLQTIYTFDFTDPMPFLLGRRPIRYVQIGLDAIRTLPPKDERMLKSIAAADGILVPLCPIMPMREEIAKRFAPATEGRQRISLTPCWDLLIRNGSDFASVH
jgi:hypothetical protein